MIKFEDILNTSAAKPLNPKKFSIITLGCKVNVYESEVVRTLLEAEGYVYDPAGKQSDIYLVNTCSVTNVGESKSRKAIRRAKRNNPKAIVVVLGCYSQIKPDEVLAIEGVNLVIGNKNRVLIPKLIRGLKPCSKVSIVSDIFSQKEFEELGVDIFKDKTRVFLKVQDGCNMFCTYCLIPYSRGRIRSRDKSYVVSEVKKLVSQNYKEVVLTGIHLASYGKDIKGKYSLIDLIETVANETDVERIRLGSLEPLSMTDDVIERLAKIDKLCPQFHLSLQSGCDKILKDMNRRYTTGQYYKVVKKLRQEFENPSITTDIIVGFPGETDEEFNTTVQFVEKVKFASVHVFKYSMRDGTIASDRADQVDEKVKTSRSNKLIEVCAENEKAYLESMLGCEVEMLVERCTNLISKGLSKNHVQIEVYGELEVNKVYKVKIDSVKKGKLGGKVL